MPDPSFYAQQAAQQAQQQARQAHQQAVRAHQQAVQDAVRRGHRPPPAPVHPGRRGRAGGLVPFLLLVVVVVVLARDAALRDSVLGSLHHLLTKVLHR
ncbi:hypothetical protein ACIRPX_27630 [Streptomyces sp. NPDC101225]|uniref:hypothetical protein n=1 Tax=Streptomyces sp. NPDC101225 TaxID=3366135 RepID=UPI00380793A2